MKVLGISCFYHDSAACLLIDGRVVGAAQEERFTREKNTAVFPTKAVKYCLKTGEIGIQDVDFVAFYEKPYQKFERVIFDFLRTYPFSFRRFVEVIPYWLKERLVLPIVLKEELGYEGKILYVPHHLSHAASTFFVSPFREAAIVTADALGEWATTTISSGKENEIKCLKEVDYPNSLGLFYSAITTYLGFRVNTGEGKVMAFASYGKPKYKKEFKKLISYKSDGSFCLNPEYFEFNRGERMYTSKLIDLFGPPREGDYSDQKYFDIAATLQKVTEEIIVNIANEAYRLTKSDNLCLAGGIFLNCVANSQILKKTRFKNLYIQPAAGDAGGALGSALATYYQYQNNERRDEIMESAALGPAFSNSEIERFLRKKKVLFRRLTDGKILEYISEKLVKGEVLAVLKGRMEYGPRALGNRSILAPVVDKEMRNYLNNEVKHREWFRPYGIIILREELEKYFDFSCDSPFMLLVGKVKNKFKEKIPSALHIDGTARLQTVSKKNNLFLYSLLKEYQKKSGLPMVINTSFNDNNEPIVCTPEDAYKTFMKSPIKYLIIENYVIEK